MDGQAGTALTATTEAADGADIRHAEPTHPGLTRAGQAAVEVAQEFARRSASPATLRAYQADWAHYRAWCERTGFQPLPASPKTVGAYLASLAASHAPSSICRRLAAIGKAHRFNDLPWNPGHRDIQEPLQGVLRFLQRPVDKAAALRLDTQGASSPPAARTRPGGAIADNWNMRCTTPEDVLHRSDPAIPVAAGQLGRCYVRVVVLAPLRAEGLGAAGLAGLCGASILKPSPICDSQL